MNKMKHKGRALGTLFTAMLLLSMVFVPAASAQANPLNSTELAYNYQNTAWDAIKLLATGNSNGITDEIFFLKKGNVVKYLEIINDGSTLQTKELSPSLLNSVKKEEILSTKSVQNNTEEAVAQTLRITNEDFYKISGEITSVVVKHTWTTIEAKNIFGIVLYSLTASGYFHYDPGVQVTYVSSDSSAYSNTALGWSVGAFSSSASWNTQIGTVNANARFDSRFYPSVNGWSQVQVDKNGIDYHSGQFY
ncbi:MAG: hypothetical protein FIB07_00430 [Candidatus Methanoperedens sp.]|nr:hypothetical protein [Candidatus Methanoperedens sp.]